MSPIRNLSRSLTGLLILGLAAGSCTPASPSVLPAPPATPASAFTPSATHTPRPPPPTAAATIARSTEPPTVSPTSTPTPSSRVARVIVVSVDGLRPDALLQADTPHMDGLWRNGAYTWTAQTVLPSVTLVSHASMLSGLPPEVHGIDWNDWDPSRGYIQVETIFSQARQAGFATAMVVGKRKMEHLATPGTVDRFEFPGTTAAIVAEASAKVIRELRPGVMFVHFPDPDTAGHSSGWMSGAQLEAIGRVDEGLGQILQALDETGQRPATLLILTADHGGRLFFHGSDDPQDTTIPWIAQGPGVPSGLPISGIVRTFDTAATVLYALQLPVPADWAGTPVIEALPHLAVAGSNQGGPPALVAAYPAH